MQRLKLIPSLCLLSALIGGMSLSIATAQTQRVPMSNSISTILPTTDPYCTPREGVYENLSSTALSTDRFNDSPELCTRVSVASIPTGVTDWVLVELRVAVRSGTQPDSRDANNSASGRVIARKPAFLLNNGRIVDAAGYVALDSHDPTSCNETGQVVADLGENANCPDLVFDEGNIADALDANDDGTDDDIYLVIRHRNHLDIMSSTPLSETSGAYTYDFTSNVSNARSGGGGIKAAAGPPSRTRIAMFGGDADLNGSINVGDFSGSIFRSIGATDYNRGDTNLGGSVNVGDFSDVIFRNIGNTSAVSNIEQTF